MSESFPSPVELFLKRVQSSVSWAKYRAQQAVATNAENVRFAVFERQTEGTAEAHGKVVSLAGVHEQEYKLKCWPRGGLDVVYVI